MRSCSLRNWNAFSWRTFSFASVDPAQLWAQHRDPELPNPQGPEHHGRLPKPSVRRALRQAWELNDAAKAERLIRNLAQRMEQEAPGVD
jgi:putative transposase